MWTPNSIQIPTDLAIKAAKGEISADALLGVVAILTSPTRDTERVSRTYPSLTREQLKEAETLLQIEHFVTEEKEESPSTPTEEETPNPESKVDFSFEALKVLKNKFPDANMTDKQLDDLEEKTGGDVSWVDDAVTCVYQGHLEKGNVYEPIGLIFWWITKNPRMTVHNKAQAIRNRPKTRDSIIGESMERARKNIPPPPGPTPEKIAAQKAKNEKLKNAKS